MDVDALKLFGAGGGFLVILAVCAWLMRYVLTAVVASIRELRNEINDHTAKDLEHHAEVKEAIVRVEAALTADRQSRRNGRR